ncbi:HAMP domain-containing sensor histidine kinase [Clostridium hydrogeniformans]|uniref:HAMP domain-containing sensor histidine kinase n=1 Tax=Clostridium hydrogeniformans TaxID=349933 RepID=UPI0004840A82|nr:HAMP domain-containing sensor histidine kinase [Clostridium hydrogeniformans]
MGNNRIKKGYIGKRVAILTWAIYIIIVLSLIYSILMLNKKSEKIDTSNPLRIETSNQRDLVKEMFKENNYYMKSDFYNYVVINLNGEVIFSSIDDFVKGEKINIETQIGYDNVFIKNNQGLIRYSTPLVIDGLQEGTIIIDLPQMVLKYGEGNREFVPLWLLLFLIGILIFKVNKFVQIDIINPIREIHSSARAILNGNYNSKIIYDYHGEVGEFCHDFEAMRDEIKHSKEKEEELKRNEKELLACISHDLKTPLSSISGYIEGIRDGIVKDEEGIKRYSNIILKKSKELSKLIDDILEQSKTELNEMKMERREVYFDDYLIETLEDLSIDVANYNMKLIVKGVVPRTLVFIDTIRINQVINNIITNSIKYSKSGENIEVLIDEDISKITINIKDFGSGIGIEDIPFVFNKFYRGEKYRNTNIPGSGLGLSIAKYIVEFHGGTIKCSSSFEEGTIISFTIPKI